MSYISDNFGRGSRPPQYFGKGYDFLSDEELTEWAGTAIASGAAGAVVDTVHGGALVITSGGAGQGHSYQLDATPIFLSTADKPVEFKCRFQVSALTCEFIAGLIVRDTTGTSPLYDGVTDGLYFRVDADGNLDIVCEQSSTNHYEQTAVATLAIDTDYDLYIQATKQADGTTKVVFRLDGDFLGEATLSSAQAISNGLVPSFEWSDANTETCRVDFVGFSGKR